MPYGYSVALRTRLETRALLTVHVLVEIQDPGPPSALIGRWSLSGRDVSYDGSTWAVDNPLKAVEPASIANERDLLALVLTDPSGTWRERFAGAGVVNLPVRMFALEASTGEPLEQFRGYVVGMSSRDNDLHVRVGGPFSKIGSRRGVYTSEGYQKSVQSNDTCMDQADDTLDLTWYLA